MKTKQSGSIDRNIFSLIRAEIYVVFGATSDWGRGTYFPAQHHLFKGGRKNLKIFALTSGDPGKVIPVIGESILGKNSEMSPEELDVLEAFLKAIVPVQVDVNDVKSLVYLKEQIEKLTASSTDEVRIIYEVLLSFSLYPTIIENGYKAGLFFPNSMIFLEKTLGMNPKQVRFLREKCLELHLISHLVIRDHYGSKPSLLYISSGKLNNHLAKLPPVDQVRNIRIVISENVLVGDRSFFHEASIFRDFYPHVVLILTTICAGLTGAFRPFSVGSEIRRGFVDDLEKPKRSDLSQAQYKGLSEEVSKFPNVMKTLHKEDLINADGELSVATLSAVKLTFEKGPFQGVRVVAVTGKALKDKQAFIEVLYSENRVLRLQIQPDPAITFTLGDGTRWFHENIPKGDPEYVTLLNAGLNRTYENFVSYPEICTTIDKFTELLGSLNDFKLPQYEVGSHYTDFMLP